MSRSAAFAAELYSTLPRRTEWQRVYAHPILLSERRPEVPSKICKKNAKNLAVRMTAPQLASITGIGAGFWPSAHGTQQSAIDDGT